MLRVELMGNLGAEPEQRFTQAGAAMTTFRVAVNQVRTGPDGERQENTEWFRVRAMGRLADTAQRLTKGGRVLVFGRLDISHYQSREGEPRTGFDVWADEVVNLAARPLADGDTEPAEAATDKAAPRASSGAEDLEDLPF